jgi:hypothetical protein
MVLDLACKPKFWIAFKLCIHTWWKINNATSGILGDPICDVMQGRWMDHATILSSKQGYSCIGCFPSIGLCTVLVSTEKNIKTQQIKTCVDYFITAYHQWPMESRSPIGSYHITWRTSSINGWMIPRSKQTKQFCHFIEGYIHDVEGKNYSVLTF